MAEVISRSNAAALIPEEAATEIIKEMPKSSTVLQTFRQVPMSRKQKRMPVLSVLPTAQWVSPTDTGLKGTTNLEWENVYLNAEELAVIVPIPEAVLDDSDYDIWAEVQPGIAEAMGQALDLAALFGTSAPTSWDTDSVVEAAVNAGNVNERGNFDYLWQDVLGEGGVFNKVEEDGYSVNFAIARVGFKAALRGESDADGRPIWSMMPSSAGPASVLSDGTPIVWSENGGWNHGQNIDLIVGDRTKGIVGLRQDITYKVLTEAVISDSEGAIVYNLAQQDMVALRVVFRVAFATVKPPTRLNKTSTRCPFAVLRDATS